MNRAARYPMLKFVVLFVVIGVVLVQGPAFVLEVVAQATSTPIPSPTVAPTSTPTSTATTGPAPTSTSTPGGTFREVDLRPTDDKIEIDSDECVEFNWRVTDCNDSDSNLPDFCLVDWKIEVEGEDTELIPVTDFDTRLECPDEDTKYTLIVQWKNDGQEKREEREVEVNLVDEGDGGDGGGGPGAPPTPGAFIVVTPILITRPQVIVPPPPPGSGQTQPGGVLDTVTELPETGASAANPISNRDASLFDRATLSGRFQVVANEFPALRLILLVAGLAAGFLLFLTRQQRKR
jgi:hypothetical protein